MHPWGLRSKLEAMRSLRAGWLGSLGLAVAACGPSFQTIYENDVRFEHCYALDDSGSASLKQKAECWKDWKEHHTFGQTRDRVEYAQSRYVALHQIPILPTDEAMMAGAPGEVGEKTQLTAPTPTNAFAPPPTTMDFDASTLPTVAPTLAAVPTQTTPAPGLQDAGAGFPRPPGAACQDDCSVKWQSCRTGHTADGGPDKRCDDAYDRCIVVCVKK